MSDNSVERPCFAKFQPYESDSRFHYYTPPSPLGMCDNWDFALSKATGEYVSVISDKFMLRPDALRTVFNMVEKYPAELISWWHEKVLIQDESEQRIRGRYVPILKPELPKYFDPIEVIRKRFEFDRAPYSRSLGSEETLGKIYSGCFHRDLIERIIENFGRVFLPSSPDITSMLAGLSLAKTCLDVGQPLMLACSSADISNGIQCKIDTNNVRRYLTSVGINPDEKENDNNEFPLRDFWVCTNNSIAKDYTIMQAKSNNTEFKALKLNMINLLVRVKEDLAAIKSWKNDNEKKQLVENWQLLFDQCSKEQQDHIKQQLVENNSIKPSRQEIHFAGGMEIDTFQSKLSAKKRAEMNWLEHRVFRINDQYLYYDSLEEAFKYFTDFYLHSAALLKLPFGVLTTGENALAET